MNRMDRAPALSEERERLRKLLSQERRFRLEHASHGQSVMWFLHLLAPAAAAYHAMFAARLSLPVDVAALRQALRALVQRHPTLRTTYLEAGGSVFQRVWAEPRYEFLHADASALEESALTELLSEHAHRPFDLEQGPVFRAVLLSRGADSYLVISIHHIAIDGSSLEVLVRELESLYGQAATGGLGALEEATAYGRFARWEREWLASPRAEAALGFWSQRLAVQAPELELDKALRGGLPGKEPVSHSSAPSFTGDQYCVRWSAADAQRLKAFARQEGVSLYTLALTGLFAALHRLTGREQIALGSIASNRNRTEFESAVGYYVNTVVLQASPSGDSSFRTLLHQVHAEALAALEHRSYPLNLLVEKLKPARKPGRQPWFQVVLNWLAGGSFDLLNAFFLDADTASPARAGGLGLVPLALRRRIARFELELLMGELGGELLGVVQYDTGLFGAEEVAALMAYLHRVLLQAVEHPEHPLSLLPPFEPPARPAESEQAPCSFTQEHLWRVQQLASELPVGTLLLLRLEGPLEPATLERALGELGRRHEVLRTTLAAVNGNPVQVIAPEPRLPLPVDSLPPALQAEQQEWLLHWLQEEALRPFALDAGPLLRARLLRVAPGEHLLVLHAHRSLLDRDSMGRLVEELTAVYRALSTGQPLPPPSAAQRFADFARSQREHLRGERLERLANAWAEVLQPPPPVLALPGDRQRPGSPTLRGGRHRFALSRELSARLRAWSHAERVELPSLLLAGFGALLHRHTGQAELALGTPTPESSPPGPSPIIGPLTTTRVLRLRLDGDPAFHELVRRVQQVALEASRRPVVPFERLLDALQPGWALSPPPWVQASFSFQESPHAPRLLADGVTATVVDVHDGELDLPRAGLRLELSRLAVGATWLDLSLSVVERQGQLLGMLEYSTELFDADTIVRMGEHLQVLLEAAVAAPAQRLSQLQLLTEAERHRLLVEWNATQEVLGAQLQLQHLFETQAERTPESLAVVFEGQQLTYAQLERRANQLAHHLQGLGVGPDTLVGVCMERSLELVVALLAILKAGGAYVPFDPAYPRERLEFMLSDSKVPVLLIQEHLRSSLPGEVPVLVSLGAGEDSTHGLPETRPPCAAGPEHLAYVIFTSGSTGRPKGAMNSHGGIVNRIRWMQREYGLTARDRVLQKTPFSFDVSVWEFFWPLSFGACLVVARPEGHKDTAYLARLIHEQQVTVLHFVPSMLQAFLEEPDLSGCVSLREVMCSGEALPLALQERFHARLDARLHNLYGPTEAAVDVTFWACERNGQRAFVPIGRPLSNIKCYVLDRHLRPTPIGVPGELYLGGVGVGRGYLGRPELTAERFLPDPHGGEPGARLYRTGDLARWRATGELEYLGRTDTQVKVRGFRIELGEVEAALARCPEVLEAAVVARPLEGQESLGLQLIAYVAPRGMEGAPAPEGPLLDTPWQQRITQALRAVLPEYMVPAVMVFLPALPHLPNGKVDRKALPEPPSARQARGGPPRTGTERALASLWAEVLELDPSSIGTRDLFWELGGHSLLLPRLARRMEEHFGRKFTVPDLLRFQDIASAAAWVDEAGDLHPSSLESEQGRERGSSRRSALLNRRSRPRTRNSLPD